MLTAAISSGADAIYFGIKGFNMRAAAQNFSLAEAKKVIAYCHKNNVKAYCTINIIIFEQELTPLTKTLQALKTAQVDAIICWDLAVINLCKQFNLKIHLSTQASVANSAASELWKSFGVKRIVLARECSLEDIKTIKKKTKLPLEIFIHGARCISLSGRCFLSQELFQKSANRGECLQPCRREYKVTDEEGKQMVLENNFIMSAKDLCTLPLLPQILKLGVDSLKIEGRNRGADYVYNVVSVYRTVLTAIQNKQFTPELITKLTTQLQQSYNKGFSTGYLIDYPYHQRCNIYGNKATTEKILLGKVSNFYHKNNAVEFKLESASLAIGDKLLFIGPTSGSQEQLVAEIRTDTNSVSQAQKGEIITVPVSFKLREHDMVYLVKERGTTK